MLIQISDYPSVVEKAKASFEKYEIKGRGVYQHNKLDGVLVGMKCEAAAHQFLIQNGLKASLSNSDKTSDVLLKDFNIEIKGLRTEQWDKFKRCVPPKQLESYVKKNAIIIWGTTTVSTENCEAVLKGWNFAKDVFDKGIYRKTICDNIWLREDKDMRELNELLCLILAKYNGPKV